MKKRLTLVSLIFAFVSAAIINKIVNERNVQHLGQTFSEIYDDRLLVESYIYQLTDLFYKKKIALLNHENRPYAAYNKSQIQKQTSEITELAGKYASTKLTVNEQKVFEQLSATIERLKAAEGRLHIPDNGAASELKEICELSFNQLKLLSLIQVAEGSLLKEDSKRVLNSSQIAGHLEWAIYAVILLCFVAAWRKKGMPSNIFKQFQLN
jgi:hypothetical protein